jgi:hypothetical protein
VTGRPVRLAAAPADLARILRELASERELMVERELTDERELSSFCGLLFAWP